MEHMKPNYIYKAIIQRVVDGDTVVADIDLGFDTWIRNQHIRFYNYDAPETRTKDPEEKKRGLEAKQCLCEHVKPGQEVLLHSQEYDRGKYGRILGDIETDTLSSVITFMKANGHEK